MPDNLEIIDDLERVFFNHLAASQKNDGGIDDIAVMPLLDAWASCLSWAKRANLTDKQASTIAISASSAADQYSDYRKTEGSAKRSVLRAMEGLLHEFEGIFVEQEFAGVENSDVPTLRRKLDRAKDSSELAFGVMAHISERFEKINGAVAEAQAAAKRASEAVELAEQAATKSATSVLERSFQTTATANAWVSWVFRVLTVLLLAFTIFLGWQFAIGHTPVVGQPVDWYGIVYRVAILSGLGALAAYLGRQAGNYARLTTWAHSIQIQLKAFRGFVNEVEDPEARQTLMAMFGKRVLESPPDGKSTVDDGPTNLIQPIFEQAARMRPPQQ